MKETFRYKNWEVVYTPEDGARLDKLAYNGVDLLTTEPGTFRPPKTDYGSYETRPVYGYDDCFPSVEECAYPGSSWQVPDHGEVCWLSWNCERHTDRLLFSVESEALPVVFHREMRFAENTLIWSFLVRNKSDRMLPFQHVIHPLMPLSQIKEVQLPPFDSVYDEIGQKTLNLKQPEEVRAFLADQSIGTANMLFLRKIKEGKLSLTFRAGLTLEMTFPSALFPSIGIWWNNAGYPDEPGIRRDECAFEPIPGLNSRLSDAHKNGLCLNLPSEGETSWQIEWKIT